MGRFDTVKTAIDANVNTNGNQEITGSVLNTVMNQMVDATDAAMTETDAKLTELAEEINGNDVAAQFIGVPFVWNKGYLVNSLLNYNANKSFCYSKPIFCSAGTKIFVKAKGNYISLITRCDEDGNLLESLLFTDTPTEIATYTYEVLEDMYVVLCTNYATGGSAYINGFMVDIENKGKEVFALIQELMQYCGLKYVPKFLSGYINTNGGVSQGTNFLYCDFLPILKKDFTIVNFQGRNEYMAGVAFYDENKTFISMVQSVTSTQVGTYTIKSENIPTNAKYIRVSFPLQDNYQSYIQFGYENKDIVEYILQIKQNEESQTDNVFSGDEISNVAINQNEVATLIPQHIGKDYVVSAQVKGVVDNISFGVGYSTNADFEYRSYAALWVEIDSINIKQYRYYNEDYVLIGTYPHGMTLSNSLNMQIHSVADKLTLSMLTNDGQTFEKDLQSGGVGTPFIENNGSGTLNVTMSFFAQCINSPIWVFGDSYFSFASNNGWTYYLQQKGYTHWLSNNQPGLSPKSAVSELRNLLACGCPQYLIWCLGMNGEISEDKDSNGDYVINAYQKQYIDEVMLICETFKITPIFGIVPTTPIRQKTGFGRYIKSLGVRYIDFADAVGTNENGEWDDGLLSNDQVHPTATGALVLSARAILDAPELTIL